MRMRLGRPDLEQYAERFDLLGADGDLAVTFGGVSTLLFDDGTSRVLFDGFFSRPSFARVALGRVAPDPRRITAGLEAIEVAMEGGRLDAVVPVHSHFDHALDSAAVAERTGALLIGGESTANLGRGAGLAADRIRTPGDDPIVLGDWTMLLRESRHCPPDRFPGVITKPVVPPARVSAWKCGEAWSAHLRHTSGATALVQGSAGFVPGALEDLAADVVYLGIGQLGLQPDDYLTGYWTHTVRALGARQVVLTHWDDFFSPLDRPLRAFGYAVDDLDRTMETLAGLAAADGVRLSFPTLWRRENPWAA